MQTKILLVLILFSLCACQHSPRKEYFALSATALASDTNQGVTNQSVTSQSIATQGTLGVGPVTIPEYLQHNKISYWRTPQQIEMLQNHYWAEPLEQGIARVLAAQLQQQIPVRMVKFPWRRSQQPQYAVRMDIQRLDALANQAVLEADLELLDAQHKILASRHLRLSTEIPATTAPAIAAAFSRLVQEAAASFAPLVPSFAPDVPQANTD